MPASNTFRALTLAAAVAGAFAAQGASARTLWTVDGPIEVPAATVPSTRTPLAATGTPAQVFLERSGATGGEGQHG